MKPLFPAAQDQCDSTKAEKDCGGGLGDFCDNLETCDEAVTADLIEVNRRAVGG